MAEKASRRLWSELTFTLDLASVGHRKAVSFRAPSKVYQPLIKTVMKIFPFYPAPMLSYSISQKILDWMAGFQSAGGVRTLRSCKLSEGRQ